MQGVWVRRPENYSTVVFVHGILSSGETCWTHKNGTYWPKLIASEETYKETGLYVFTYKTSLFSGTYRLGDVVDALKEHLDLDGVLNSKNVIFVCHSMGGIVVRKYLVERAIDLIDKKTKVGLFLIASPSLGSDYANWLAPIAKYFKHTQADALRFSQTNAWLLDLDREFLNLKEHGYIILYGKELVEDNFILLKTLMRKQVVQPFSGARYFGEPFKVPNSDHFSIAKPEGKEAIQHRLLLRFLLEFATKDQNKLHKENQLRKPASEIAQVQLATELSDNSTNQTLSSINLLDYPVGPVVTQYAVRNLSKAYAEYFSHFEAKQLINEINSARQAVNPKDPHVGQIRKGRLPDPALAGLENFWLEVFDQAALHGPRMLATVVSTLKEAQLSDDALREQKALLKKLRNYKN